MKTLDVPTNQTDDAIAAEGEVNPLPEAQSVFEPRSPSEGSPVDVPVPAPVKAKAGNLPRHDFGPITWTDKIEAFVSKLSVRDNFWRSVCSLIWLPLAFFSGLKLKRIRDDSFAFVLPFRRFNRNWYRAMAGGALLANSEIAGGTYVFGIVGGGYTVVCKNLNYTFLRPCYGPAIYRFKSRENVMDLAATGNEFNVTLDLEVLQQAGRLGERDKRVGKCEATFHVTPKEQHKVKAARRKV